MGSPQYHESVQSCNRGCRGMPSIWPLFMGNVLNASWPRGHTAPSDNWFCDWSSWLPRFRNTLDQAPLGSIVFYCDLCRPRKEAVWKVEGEVLQCQLSGNSKLDTSFYYPHLSTIWNYLAMTPLNSAWEKALNRQTATAMPAIRTRSLHGIVSAFCIWLLGLE